MMTGTGRRLVGVGLGGVWALPLAAQELEVKPAYMEDVGTELVAFDPFEPLDWEALARIHFADFDIDSPPAEAIRRNWYEIGHHAEFHFEASLPPGRDPGAFYLITDLGVLALEPVRLAGTIRYGAERDGSRVEAPRFFGSVVAAAPGAPLRDPGFVVRARPGLYFRTATVGVGRDADMPRLVQRQVAGASRWVLEDTGGARIVPAEGPPRPAPLETYTVGIGFGGGPEYLFVRWGGDTACDFGCCEQMYDLFRLDETTLEPVAALMAACDV